MSSTTSTRTCSIGCTRTERAHDDRSSPADATTASRHRLARAHGERGRTVAGAERDTCEHRVQCAPTPPITAACSSGAGPARRRSAFARCPSAAATCAGASTARSRASCSRGWSVLSLLCWGPIPIACLWIAAQVNYLSGSVTLGIFVAFVGLFVLLFGALAILRRMDQAWILVRRAAGHDQRTGALGRVFAITAVICGTLVRDLVRPHPRPGIERDAGQQTVTATPPRRRPRHRRPRRGEADGREPARLLPPVRRHVRGGGQRGTARGGGRAQTQSADARGDARSLPDDVARAGPSERRQRDHLHRAARHAALPAPARLAAARRARRRATAWTPRG